MATSIRKAPGGSGKKSVQQDVASELKAMKAAFKRVSKNRSTTIRFLHTAGIVTKTGRLSEAYR